MNALIPGMIGRKLTRDKRDWPRITPPDWPSSAGGRSPTVGSMHEQHATRPRGGMRIGRGEPQRRSMPAHSRTPRERSANEQEIDRAFLEWFEARLVKGGPSVRDEDVLDYLIALGLYNRSWTPPVRCGRSVSLHSDDRL
jgi:hypothetical protein